MKYASEYTEYKDTDIKSDNKKIEQTITKDIEDEALKNTGRDILQSDTELLQPIIFRMTKSYDNKKKSKTDKEWLIEELQKELPDKTQEECQEYAEKILQTIEINDKSIAEVNEYCDKGGIKENWLADKLSEASTGMSILQYGEYLSKIDRVLFENNKNMLDVVLNKDLSVNQNANLHGFIARQVLANSFNRNAVLQNSDLRAKVIKSVRNMRHPNEFVILDKDNNSVEYARTNYYKNAEATAKVLNKRENFWNADDISNITPKGQLTKVRHSMSGKLVKDHLGGEKTNGIISDKFSKKDVEAMQKQIQKEGVFAEESWNSYNTRDLAYNIGRQIVYTGATAAVFNAGLDIVYKTLSNKKIDPSETMELTIKTGTDTGAKAVVAGAIKVCSEKGLLTLIPKGTSGFAIGTIACIAVENAKIAYKFANNEISGTKAIDMLGRVSCGTLGGALGGLKGGLAASLNAALVLSNPICIVAAGLVGTVVGSVAGNKVGEVMYEGVKKVAGTVGSVVKKAGRYVADRIEKAVDKVADKAEKVFDGVCEGISSILSWF